MDSDINNKFGRAVASMRNRQGISQSELAYRCGLHRTYIGAIERGEKSPTLNTVERIAKGLSVSIEALPTD
ncbi:MAG: helix-turn-helix transcriptional regulator [Muribaculaceae bacterium]|nr:helix-turn-helix transcriptional regulator [Muribaculaceae bacterium]